MSESYVECLVKSDANIFLKLIKYVLIMLTVVLAIFTILGYGIAMIVAVVTGFGAYLMHLRTNIEYEYLYLDKEIAIDKIMAKTKRKKVGTFEVDRMEILAPINSHQLDSYKHRTAKEFDYSIKHVEQPDMRYVMFYNGDKKLILSPNEQIIKAIKNVAPRKVFMD